MKPVELRYVLVGVDYDTRYLDFTKDRRIPKIPPRLDHSFIRASFSNLGLDFENHDKKHKMLHHMELVDERFGVGISVDLGNCDRGSITGMIHVCQQDPKTGEVTRGWGGRMLGVRLRC